MTTTTTTTTREGIQTVVPYLAVRPALELVEFMTRAFGAKERLEDSRRGRRRARGSAYRGLGADDRRGADVGGAPTPTGLHLYVPMLTASIAMCLRRARSRCTAWSTSRTAIARPA